MKYVKLIFSIFLFVCVAGQTSFADRLYIWTDADGKKHISQHAPPPSGVLTDIMDYRSRPRQQTEKAAPRQTPVAVTEQEAPAVQTSDNACILNAANSNVSVTVWDYDSAGNRQNVLFRGRLEKGQQQEVVSVTGNIVFSYQRDNESKRYGHNRRTCQKGTVIILP